jgi:hypothetical protein
MTTRLTQADPSPNEPRPTAPSNAVPTASAADLNRLLEEVRRLELERLHDRRIIETLQTECKAYRQALADWARHQIAPEDLKRWASDDNEEGNQQLFQFVDELDSIVKAHQKHT